MLALEPLGPAWMLDLFGKLDDLAWAARRMLEWLCAAVRAVESFLRGRRSSE
jgi:hypothetical protein